MLLSLEAIPPAQSVHHAQTAVDLVIKAQEYTEATDEQIQEYLDEVKLFLQEANERKDARNAACNAGEDATVDPGDHTANDADEISINSKIVHG